MIVTPKLTLCTQNHDRSRLKIGWPPVPLAGGTKRDKSVTVAMAEPQNIDTLGSLRSFLGVDVKGVIASEQDVLSTIEKIYAVPELENFLGDRLREGR